MILEELRLLVSGRSTGRISCQLSSNMITKRDGSFFANPDEPVDPGAAVWWLDHAGELCVIACDAWNTVQGNFRAIALNIRHMRAVQRTKATQIFGRMQQSFRIHTLAAENPVHEKPPCAQVLGLERWPVARDELNRVFRQLAKARHPDRGADEAEFKQISDAYAECLQQLAG